MEEEFQSKTYYVQIKAINRDKLEEELDSDSSYLETEILKNLNNKLNL